MASEDGSRKRDIFASEIFCGLTSSEHLRVLADGLRFLPAPQLKMCVEAGCEALGVHGTRCDFHRKAKAAEASRAYYLRYGKKRPKNEP